MLQASGFPETEEKKEQRKEEGEEWVWSGKRKLPRMGTMRRLKSLSDLPMIWGRELQGQDT